MGRIYSLVQIAASSHDNDIEDCVQHLVQGRVYSKQHGTGSSHYRLVVKVLSLKLLCLSG